MFCQYIAKYGVWCEFAVRLYVHRYYLYVSVQIFPPSVVVMYAALGKSTLPVSVNGTVPCKRKQQK